MNLQNGFGLLKRLVVGRPIRSSSMGKTLLSKKVALPVFASDALSSVAYAPDEVLIVLGLAGITASVLSLWVGIAVALVLFIVVMSYRQVVHAYPSGGGDYAVVAANFGPKAALSVASALLVDYILTVAVSISSGAHYIVTALPALSGYEVLIAVSIIVFLSLINLRGVRESGTAFAIPTYIYMFSLASLAVAGFWQDLTGNLEPAPTAGYTLNAAAGYDNALLGLGGAFLLLRAFSSGCVALTGVEAIANGVPAFKKPKSKNAATTLGLLGLISASMMLTVLYLSQRTGVKIPAEEGQLVDSLGRAVSPGEVDPAIGQLAATIFSSGSFMFYLITVVTGLILVLAANTAFNGFPQLASVLSRDSFLPRQLHKRGDRLSYSNGILVLAGAAIVLVVAFNADTTRLIQMYIVGVFISFTISQLGMVRHWTRRLRLAQSSSERYRLHRSRAINVIGFVCTLSVLIVVVSTKFAHGAWVTLLLMGLVYGGMIGVYRHYRNTHQELEIPEWDSAKSLPSRVHALVMVSRLDQPTMRAIAYARATNPATINLLNVEIEKGDSARLYRQWQESDIDVPLTVLASPLRDITGPVIQHIRSLRRRSPRDLVVVYIPYFLVNRFWEHALHNHSASRLRLQLQLLPGVVTVMVPWNLHDTIAARERKKGMVPIPAPETYYDDQPVPSGLVEQLDQGAFVYDDDKAWWKRRTGGKLGSGVRPLGARYTSGPTTDSLPVLADPQQDTDLGSELGK